MFRSLILQRWYKSSVLNFTSSFTLLFVALTTLRQEDGWIRWFTHWSNLIQMETRFHLLHLLWLTVELRGSEVKQELFSPLNLVVLSAAWALSHLRSVFPCVQLERLLAFQSIAFNMHMWFHGKNILVRLELLIKIHQKTWHGSMRKLRKEQMFLESKG